MPIVKRLTIAALLCLVPTTTASAQPKFAAIHGVSAAKYQEWTDGLDKQKLRPAFVSVMEIKGDLTFAAIAVDNSIGRTWAVSKDLTTDEYQKEFDTQRAKGFRPICVVGYRRGEVANYAAIFVKDNTPAWFGRHAMDAKQYQDAFDSLGKQGYRPVQASVFPVADGIQFAYLFIRDDIKNWISQSGLTADQFQKLIDDPSKKNSRPVSVCAYPTKFGTRFAVILAEDGQKVTWSTKHHLTLKQYEEHFKDMTGKGYLPTQICAYPWENEVRYLAVFEKEDR